MANPNPSPSTRFGPGNPSRGRQRAARDKISTAFLEALNEAFYEPNDSGGCKGLDAIKKVRDEDPATFARIYATLLPKQFEIEDTPPEAARTVRYHRTRAADGELNGQRSRPPKRYLRRRDRTALQHHAPGP